MYDKKTFTESIIIHESSSETPVRGQFATLSFKYSKQLLYSANRNTMFIETQKLSHRG